MGMLELIGSDLVITTLVAVIATTVIALVQLLRIMLRENKLQHELALLNEAKDAVAIESLRNKITASRCYRQRRCSAGLVLQILVDLSIATGLGIWGYYLFEFGMLEWTAVAGLFAVIALLMPLVVWSRFKKRNTTLGELNSAMAVSRPSSVQAPPSIVTRVSAPKAAEPPQAAIATPAAIPEDSMLRRHYLTQRQAERDAITQPYPTDCVLRRHYQTTRNAGCGFELPRSPAPLSAAANFEQQPVGKTIEPIVPEDSTLRRHYLTQRQAERVAITQSYPTDSVLRRHYESLVRARYGIEPAKPQSAMARATVVIEPEPDKPSIPEDATLRRHYLAKLRDDIQAALFPRPTDSVLQRHYDALVNLEMEKRLAGWF